MKLTLGQMIDIFFGIVILVNVILGLWRGVVKEILRLGGLILSLVLAARYYAFVGSKYISWGMPQSYGIPNIAGYITVFLGVWIGVKILIYIIEKFIQAVDLSMENRLLGGFFGFIKGGVFVFFIALIVMYVPFPSSVREKVFSSRVLTVMVQNKDKIDKAFGKGSFIDRMFPAARNKLAGTKALLDIGEEVKKDPSKLERILNSPQMQALKEDPKVREKLKKLLEDKDFQKALEEKDYVKIMSNKSVQEILADPYVRQKVMEINLEELLKKVKEPISQKADNTNSK